MGAESLSEKRKGNDFFLRCLDCVAFVLVLGITTNSFELTLYLQSESRSKMGEGRRKCRRKAWDEEGGVRV